MSVTSVHVYTHVFSFETSTSKEHHQDNSHEECPYYMYAVSGQGFTMTSDIVGIENPVKTPEWRERITEEQTSFEPFFISPYKQLRAPPMA